jgi:RHS repeat-associated protein
MILRRLALLHSIFDISPPATKVKQQSNFGKGLTHFCLLSTVALICLCFFPTNSRAQVTNPPAPVNPPIPGVGHDYIHMLSETVNPADGSVNLNIALPTPAGRGLSLPFSITYNSGAVGYLSSYQPGYIATYLTTAPSSGGWGNSLPVLSFANTAITYPFSDVAGSASGTCNFSTGYSFQGLLGGSHSLGLSATSPPPSTYANCTDMGGTIPAFFTQNYGGDSQVYSAFSQLCSGSQSDPSPYSCNPYGEPPVKVFDADGTIYSFAPSPGNAIVIESSTGTESFWPTSIEDRNGNIALMSGTTLTDTAGRSLITFSGGSTSANFGPTSITAGGLTYALTYASYAATYYPPGPDEQLPPLGWTSIPSGLTCAVQGFQGNPATVVKTITLPNYQTYTFSYEPTYGLLSEIQYPDGGWVKYTWEMSPVYTENALFYGLEQSGYLLQDGCNFLFKTPVVLTRQVGFATGSAAALTQTFTYNATWNSTQGSTNDWLTKTTTVQTTDNVTGRTSQTIYNYTPVTINPAPGFSGTGSVASQIPVEQSVQYYDWGPSAPGPLIQTVSKSWFDQFNLQGQQTALNTASPAPTSEVTYQYGFGGAVTQKQEYDFGSGAPGTLLRTTVNNYQTFAGNPLLPIQVNTLPSNLLTFPCQSIVYNGTVSSANRVAETDIQYDGGTSVCGTAGTPSVSPVSGGALPTGTHDETYYGSSTTTPAPRGNATSVIKQCFPSCTNPTSTYTYTYDETGQALTMTDPCGNASCSTDMTGTNHTTTYSYTDSYTSGTPSGNTNAYLTKVTRPTASNGVSHISNYSYSYLEGELTVAKDENGQPTTYTYADSLGRLTAVNYPDNGQTAYAYYDAGPSPTITTSKLITSSIPLTTITTLDGMGHPVGTQLKTDPQGPDYTATTYDGMGNIYTASNPYRSTSDTTYGITTSLYDPLRRPKLITKPDGSTVSIVYTGNCTTVTDEAGKTREGCIDGLGRMTEVIENPGTGGLNWMTNYTYDALDDLTTVLQGGSRKRSFIYDSLRRLTSSANPETGGTSNPVLYTYDANGNVTTKTDARGIKITYTWDVLNRMNQRTYPNGDHYVGYGYDSATCVAVPSCFNIGHMTSMTDAAGTESSAYDQMGRLWGDQRTTNSIPKNTSYVYYLDGSLQTLIYPSGHSVAYTPGGAGLPLSAADSTLATYYASNAGYAPWGARSYTQFAGGSTFAETILYNTRLQPCWSFVSTSATLTATTCTGSETGPGTLMDVQYNFNLGADNGNLGGITNNRNTNRSQSYSYDAVNRIAGAATVSTCTANCWHLAFGVDEWANITAVSGTGNATLSPNGNNQIGAALFTYDASGNELTDATSTYAWNAESQMKTGGGVTYDYDGRGNRVEKSGTKLYWYGQNGQVLDETDTTGSTANAAFSEYIYFAGARIARRDYLNNVYYYFEDQVNSSRVIAEMPAGSTTPTLCYDADFYPYGGEIDFMSTCAQNYKFQGKERDTETNNDYFGARFYSSTYGRFLSPDWSSVPAPVPYANLTNPQTLNLYSFVVNNPGSFTDLAGHTAGCVSVMVSGSEDCNSPNNGSPVFTHPHDPGCATGDICVHTWQPISVWGRMKRWFSSPGSGGDSEWLSVSRLANLHRAVKTMADVVAAVAAVGDNFKMGFAGAAVSIINDPKPANIAITGVGLIPGPDVPIAIGTVAWDGSKFAGNTIQQVFTPDASQSDYINDGSGRTIRSPDFQNEDLCASYGACN